MRPVAATELSRAPDPAFEMRRALDRAARRIGVAAALGLVLLEASFAVRVVALRFWTPSTSAFMETRARESRRRGIEPKLDQRWLAYGALSPVVKRAVLAAEDRRFFSHRGFDWESIQRAWRRNQAAGRIVCGGSTITQQLAKNLFLSASRTYARKSQEAILAAMMEAFLSKERILELYLNYAEWGDGIFGIEAAARRHYGVAAADLDARAAASLAAMLSDPRYFGRNQGSPTLARNAASISHRMWTLAEPR